MIRAALVLILLAGTADAQCLMAAAGKCVSVPRAERPTSVHDRRPDPVEVGDMLDRAEHAVLNDREYYGLPPVRDGWVYVRIEHELYRVDWDSFEVLAKVTHHANDNWRF